MMDRGRQARKGIRVGVRILLSWILLLVLISGLKGAEESEDGYRYEILKQGRGGADNQYRDVLVDGRGVIFGAHRDGVYEFDGEEWRLIRLPDVVAANCLFRGEEGQLYVGADGEFGMLEPGETGEMGYRSLNGFLPDSGRGFRERILDIQGSGDSLVFFTDYFLMVLDGGEGRLTLIPAQSMFLSMLVLPTGIFVNDMERGMMEVMGGELREVAGVERLRAFVMLPYKGGRGFVVTGDRGIEIFDPVEGVLESLGPLSYFVNYYDIKAGARLGDGNYVLASTDDGLIFCDRGGMYLSRISRVEGELENIVYSVYEDRRGQIFAATNDGIMVVRRPGLEEEADTGRGFGVLVRRVTDPLTQGLIWGGAWGEPGGGVIAERQPETAVLHFHFRKNNFQFEYGALEYFDRDSLRYRTYLEGYEEEWRPWTGQRYSQYTNLGKGSYTFRVEAMGAGGETGAEGAYRFVVDPPWYETLWFFMVQMFFMMLFIAFSLYLYRIGGPEVVTGRLISITVLIFMLYIEMYLEPLIEGLNLTAVLSLFITAVVFGLVLVPIEDGAYRLIERYVKRR